MNNREELEKRIAAIITDINIYNQMIAEIESHIKKRDELRKELDMLLSKLCLAKGAKEPTQKQIFVFKGKMKDLLDAVQSAIQEAK